MSNRPPVQETQPLVNPGFFDAHCDTVMRVLDFGEDFLQLGGDKHISFPAMVEADVRAQVFACYVLSSQHAGREDERACQMIDTVNEMALATNGQMRVVRTAAELNEAFFGGPRAAILSLEGADPLRGKAEGLRSFFDRGIRSMIFAWQDNAFSGTAFGGNTPLTKQGRRLLGLCEELGVVVDVSHLSDRAFAEVVELSEKPFIASHSNCRALCPSLRNLTDDMIRSIANRGGVIGMNLMPSFLDPEFAAAAKPLFEAATRPGVSANERRILRDRMFEIPRPSLRWLVRHVQHVMNIGGEDCIGFGGDLDGMTQTVADLETMADYVKFLPLLRGAGLAEKQIKKICYGNFLRVFSDVLPAT